MMHKNSPKITPGKQARKESHKQRAHAELTKKCHRSHQWQAASRIKPQWFQQRHTFYGTRGAPLRRHRKNRDGASSLTKKSQGGAHICGRNDAAELRCLPRRRATDRLESRALSAASCRRVSEGTPGTTRQLLKHEVLSLRSRLGRLD